MKGATQCARRLKQLIRSLRAKLGKGGRAPAGDAITQMVLGIFSRDVPESKARQALDRLRAMVVDYNELRVVPAIEMAQLVGNIPRARVKCEDLSRALNGVFAREHAVLLERLRELPRKEVVEYLDAIDGLDPYVRARIRLFGLQQHAIPLDQAMWAYARKTGIVDPKCSLDDAQAFLERRITENEALEVVALIEKQAWAEMGAAVRSGDTEMISSVPPDRTSRNMLQAVAAGREATAPNTPTSPVASTVVKTPAGGQTAEVADSKPDAPGKKAAKPTKTTKTTKTAKAAKAKPGKRTAAKTPARTKARKPSPRKPASKGKSAKTRKHAPKSPKRAAKSKSSGKGLATKTSRSKPAGKTRRSSTRAKSA